MKPQAISLIAIIVMKYFKLLSNIKRHLKSLKSNLYVSMYEIYLELDYISNKSS